MKIENVETFLVSLPFDSGSSDGWAARGWTTLDYVMLRIDTDAGITGWSGHARVRMMNPHGSGSSACRAVMPDAGLIGRAHV